MTHKEFIEVQAKQGTEFRIMFHRDDTPAWLTVEASKVTEEGCKLYFVNAKTDAVIDSLIGQLLGVSLEYTWDELREGNVDLMEIWV